MESLRLAILLLVALAGAAQASIENEPVRVTHRNSGPRYSIDEVERTRVPAPDGAENQLGGDEPEQVGHLSIRRIFLVPMAPPSSDGLWQGPREHEAEEGEREQPMAARWPFLAAPPSRHHHHHLFGQDQASRPPQPDESLEQPRLVPQPGEREERPLFDPIQMMVELMRQALNGGHAGGQPGGLFTDLNREASSRPETERKPPTVGELAKPSAMNETKEDVVEIEGKKYLRKTVINRHVGENIILMTKRLIFVPLNETTERELPVPPTTTTTLSPQPSTSDAPTSTAAPATTSETVAETTSATVPVSSTTTSEAPPTTVATETPVPPTTSAAPAPEPSSTTVAAPEETTSAASERAAPANERLVEIEPASSTSKPAAVAA